MRALGLTIMSLGYSARVSNSKADFLVLKLERLVDRATSYYNIYIYMCLNLT